MPSAWAERGSSRHPQKGPVMPVEDDPAPYSIWAFPPREAMEVLPALLAARSVEELWPASTPFYVARTDRLSESVEQQLERLGPEGDLLRREMRPGLMDRLWDLRDRISGLFGPGPAGDAEEGAGRALAFNLPLIETLPTDELEQEYEVVFEETRRLREEIGALISAERGFAPSGVGLPEDALDFLEELEEFSDEDELLAGIANVTAYWPPTQGKPALALAQVQEDGGLPIEISLLAHDEGGHAYFVDILRRAGGKLT